MIMIERKYYLNKLKKVDILTLTEPNTPLNDADHVGSFFIRKKSI